MVEGDSAGGTYTIGEHAAAWTVPGGVVIRAGVEQSTGGSHEKKSNSSWEEKRRDRETY